MYGLLPIPEDEGRAEEANDESVVLRGKQQKPYCGAKSGEYLTLARDCLRQHRRFGHLPAIRPSTNSLVHDYYYAADDVLNMNTDRQKHRQRGAPSGKSMPNGGIQNALNKKSTKKESLLVQVSFHRQFRDALRSELVPPIDLLHRSVVGNAFGRYDLSRPGRLLFNLYQVYINPPHRKMGHDTKIGFANYVVVDMLVALEKKLTQIGSDSKARKVIMQIPTGVPCLEMYFRTDTPYSTAYKVCGWTVLSNSNGTVVRKEVSIEART